MESLNLLGHETRFFDPLTELFDPDDAFVQLRVGMLYVLLLVDPCLLSLLLESSCLFPVSLCLGLHFPDFSIDTASVLVGLLCLLLPSCKSCPKSILLCKSILLALLFAQDIDIHLLLLGLDHLSERDCHF